MWCQLSRHEAVLTAERPYNRRQSRTKIDKERSVAAKTTRKLTFVACFLSLHRITKQRRAEPELHPSSPLHFFFTRLFPVLTPTAPKSQPKLTPKINCEFQLFVIQLPFLAVFYHLCDILTEEINIKDPKPSIYTHPIKKIRRDYPNKNHTQIKCEKDQSNQEETFPHSSAFQKQAGHFPPCISALVFSL